MNKSLKLTAALTFVVLLFTSSAFAETRHRGETDSYRNGSHDVSVEGRIRDIDRDRNGFVIQLDRGAYTLLVSSDLRRTVQHLDRGDVVRASGALDSRGRMFVDRITLIRDDAWDRNDRTLRGVIDSVDSSRRTVFVREDRSGRVVAVDLRGADNRDRDDRRIRRGDRITVSGAWRGNTRFDAERYDVDSQGRR